MRTIWLCGALAIALAALPAHGEETLAHGRFASVTLYRPAGPVRSVVLFLSGDGGWNLGVVDMAEALANEGALVAGIDVPKLLANLDEDAETCVSPDGDLELCPKVPRGHVQAVVLPGGHHFGGAYDALARRIMAGLERAGALG